MCPFWSLYAKCCCTIYPLKNISHYLTQKLTLAKLLWTQFNGGTLAVHWVPEYVEQNKSRLLQLFWSILKSAGLALLGSHAVYVKMVANCQ